MFELDAILPSQFASARRSKPEHRLWAAVLSDAIKCIKLTKGHRTQAITQPMISAEATAWMLDHRGEIGAFVWVCDALDLDPEAVREAVLG